MKAPLTVLAAGAHPDDIEICCAGTLIKYVDEGHRVYVSVTCRGNAGTLSKPARQIEQTRAEEAKKAAGIIGAELIMLGIGDGELVYDRKILGVFVELVRKVRPDVIITHPPEENELHNDHMLTRRLIMDASIWAAHHNMWIGTEPPPTEVVPSLFYFDMYINGFNVNPTHFVDISTTFERKKQALSQHQSQLEFLADQFGPNFLEVVELTARLRGYQCGAAYAEAFRESTIYPRARTYRVLP